MAYNTRSLMRTASRMRVDGGRSNLQQSMVKICSDARVIVDLSHTGLQRTMDTIEVSSHPVVLSHANALDKIDSPRNVSDEVLKAVAASGGFVSAVGYTPFVFKNKQPSMEDYVEMIDDMADRAGVDHVAIAVDCEATTRGITPEEDIPAMYEMRVVSGAGYPSAYPASPCDDPQGIAPPDNIHNLTAALLARGYTEEDLAKNWGGNWLRVMEQVWG